MEPTKQTSIRMNPHTRRKIDALIQAGHSSTATGIILLAVDRLYEDEMVRGNVRQVNAAPPKKGWSTFPDQN